MRTDKTHKRTNGTSHLLSLLLELLDGPLVDATALVDQMAGGGGLARVHVANDHNVDVDLLLAHGEGEVGVGLVRRRRSSDRDNPRI